MEAALRALVEHLSGPKSDSVLHFSRTLLGSNLNSENWSLSTEDLVGTAITKRLAETSKAKAIQFGAAHRKLQQRAIVGAKARKSILHCLYLCAGHPCHAVPPSLRLGAAEEAHPAPSGSLVDATGHLRAQLRALSLAEPAPPGPTRYWPSVPEASVLQDVLFVVQGIAGQHIRLDTMTESFGIPAGGGVPKGSRQLIREVCEAGWLYQKLDALVRSPSPTSVLHQSLCSAIKGHLAEYFKLLALLQAELHVPGSSALSLRKLLAWMHEPCKRLKHLLLVVDACRDLKGGILASKVHDFVGHGDPAIRSLMANVMRLTYQPLLDMVVAWTTEGELRDPFGEFFVTINKQAPDDQYWGGRYSLAMDMVPAFISMPLAEKILLVGKSINFIRVQCDDPQWAMSPEVLAKVPRDGAIFEASTFEFSEGLQQFINSALQLVNRRLMHLLFVRFKYTHHAQALKRYMLLAQGDFIQSLMDSLQDTLGKRAAEVYRHNLVGTLDSAVKATSADKDWDVAPFLDVSLQPVEDRSAVCDKVGWDIFCLEYRVPRPLDVLFPSDVMRSYSQLFRFLWRVKRLENDLAQSWRKHMTLGRLGAARGWGWRGAAPIQKLLLQCNALRSDMVHFVFNFQYYLMFEVLEVSWTDFDQKTRVASCLDDLIAAHTQYLGTLQQAALLTPAMQPIRSKLDAVLAVIAQFVATQDCLFAALVPFADQEEDAELEADMDLDSAEGGSARSCRSAADRLQEERTIHEALHRLQDIAKQFKEKFQDLLQLITFNAKPKPKPGSLFPGPESSGMQRDLHPKDLEFLRYLGFRLDFNEFFSQAAEARSAAPYPTAFASPRPSQGTAVLSRPEAGQVVPTVPYRPATVVLSTSSAGAALPSSAPGLRRF